ncbi:DNA-binding response regulator, OmpR family, contains REC and winged-helix (wHTH) domain [Lachnospiraceae bacterium XBB2008]|nr:response regulator transcription factor [Lachnospiraceae bacterium]SCY61405.1 DNA-binding response regulator, OmpR family, contains REC and winged-helix (wHTH) domain [Lachnospiraceae bacterium XBB2008]
MSRILVVDDEKLIVKGLKYSLEQDGLTVDSAGDGEEALALIRENEYDIVLLDLMLPKMNGYEVCQEVRSFSDVPIIMLTAKSEDMDKILGLEYGADDYITKPFNILEVKARIKAIMRRTDHRASKTEEAVVLPEGEGVIEHGDLTLDTSGRRAYVCNEEVNLTAREFDLLVLFINNPNQVYTREKLLELIWGREYPGDGRTVDVHIRRLREKIERSPGDPKYVKTKWGVGYYLA